MPASTQLPVFNCTSCEIDSVKYDIAVLEFSDYVLVIVSEFGKFGNLVSCEALVPGVPVDMQRTGFTVPLFGAVDDLDEIITTEIVKVLGKSKTVLTSLSIKHKSRDIVKRLCEALKKFR